MNGMNNEREAADEDFQLADAQMIDLVQQLEVYTPTIPDGVAEHYLNRAGVNTLDPAVVRLIALAGQKFISDIVNDAMQLNKMKGSSQTSRSAKTKDKRSLLTMDDLNPALTERGIKVKKPLYYP
uniref:Transcription initiation factor TFIID subunit 10 n=1 Tax=Ciona savignyi TaxID=51511 RepID=H2ZF82_CIOSA